MTSKEELFMKVILFLISLLMVVNTMAVDVHVASLRSKLGKESGCIETLRGIGYRFRAAGIL